MKTFFIWLLMSLVPLQGIAANALLICKAANKPPVQVYVAPAGDAHAHPCAEARAALDDERAEKQAGESTCSADHAAIAWMPGSEPGWSSAHLLPIAIAYAGIPLPTFIPDGPERPPRNPFL